VRILCAVAFCALLLGAEFVAPVGGTVQDRVLSGAPPSLPRLRWSSGGPEWVVYPLERLGGRWRFQSDRPCRVSFLAGGESYRLLGLFETDLHLAIAATPARLSWLGMDELGRDRFARVIEGTRSSVILSIVALSVAVLSGLLLGAFAGWKGGFADRGLTMVADMLLALPGLFLLLALRAALPLLPAPGIEPLLVLAVLCCGAWIPVARAAQAQARMLREEGFVVAARSCGAGSFWLLRRHLLPGLWPLARAQMVPLLPALIIAEASLAYLGLGLREPAISLGTLIARVSVAHALQQPWELAPILALMFVLLLGSWLVSGARMPRPASWSGETI